MAGWWMPKGQLMILRRMAAGETLIQYGNGTFAFADGTKKRCTVSAKALLNKNLICGRRPYMIQGRFLDAKIMEITPTGRNELGYNRHLYRDEK